MGTGSIPVGRPRGELGSRVAQRPVKPCPRKCRFKSCLAHAVPASGNGITAVSPKNGCLGSTPGGSTLSRISPEWEAACKTAVAGSTPERDSIFGGGAHAMDAPPRSRSSGRNPGATRVGARPGSETPQTTQTHPWTSGPGKQAYPAADKTGLARVSVAGLSSPREELSYSARPGHRGRAAGGMTYTFKDAYKRIAALARE